MAIEVFNRCEHKYLLNFEQSEKMIETAERYMQPDAYNKDREPYTIQNIYYDTEDSALIRRSLEKPPYKQKLRLRSYGEADRVYLEIKKKYDGVVNKRRTALTPEDAEELTESGKVEIKKYMNKQVVKEIEYFLSVYEVYPQVYLAYDRIAYFDKGNSDLRISFDFSVRSRRCDLSFDCGDYGEELFPDTCIMEVKTALAKPLWLTKALSELGLRRESVSKYGTEYMKSRNFCINTLGGKCYGQLI